MNGSQGLGLGIGNGPVKKLSKKCPLSGLILGIQGKDAPKMPYGFLFLTPDLW
jgi:hypothetical protein